MAMGLDSSTSVQLTSRLQEQLQVQLPGTLAFDYPTVAEMAAHLQSVLPIQQQAVSSSCPTQNQLAAQYRPAPSESSMGSGMVMKAAPQKLQQQVLSPPMPTPAADMNTTTIIANSASLGEVHGLGHGASGSSGGR